MSYTRLLRDWTICPIYFILVIHELEIPNAVGVFVKVMVLRAM